MYLVKPPCARAHKSHISVPARFEIRFMPSARLRQLAWATCFAPRYITRTKGPLGDKYDRSDGIVGIAQLSSTPLSVQTTVPARF